VSPITRQEACDSGATCALATAFMLLCLGADPFLSKIVVEPPHHVPLQHGIFSCNTTKVAACICFCPNKHPRFFLRIRRCSSTHQHQLPRHSLHASTCLLFCAWVLLDVLAVWRLHARCPTCFYLCVVCLVCLLSCSPSPHAALAALAALLRLPTF